MILSVVLLGVGLQGCGTIAQKKLAAPKDQPTGYSEFSFDDKTRFLARGWTVTIPEMVDGNKKKYGFLGRDVLMAPFGYTNVRRIPLAIGPHTLELDVLGTARPANAKVDVDVAAGKIVPVTVIIERGQNDYFSMTCKTGVRIPTKADTCSNPNRTLTPIDIGQLSERSDALVSVIKKCPI